LMAHNAGITYSGTGVNVQPESFYFEVAEGSVILDPWRTTPDINGVRVIHYGNPRKV